MIMTSVLAAASDKGRRITLWSLSSLVALTLIRAGGARLAGAAAIGLLVSRDALSGIIAYLRTP